MYGKKSELLNSSRQTFVIISKHKLPFLVSVNNLGRVIAQTPTKSEQAPFFRDFFVNQ